MHHSVDRTRRTVVLLTTSCGCSDAERRAEQKQMEIMSLEQANAVDESAMDEPPGEN